MNEIKSNNGKNIYMKKNTVSITQSINAAVSSLGKASSTAPIEPWLTPAVMILQR